MLREYMFTKLSGDAQLNALGITADTLWANGAPDSPQSDVFAVMRWGEKAPGLAGQRGLGRAFEIDFTLWVYTRQADYTLHNKILQRMQVLLEAVQSEPTDSVSDPAGQHGWLIEAVWAGEGPDGFDDAYQRYQRNGSVMLTASGS